MLAAMAFNLAGFIWYRFIWGANVMSSLKCSCIDCDNVATHTWSGNPTCDSCGSPSRTNEEVKPFDITKHEFSDCDLSVVKTEGNTLWVDIEYGYSGDRCNAPAVLTKQDAMAIAKHFKLTGEALK